MKELANILQSISSATPKRQQSLLFSLTKNKWLENQTENKLDFYLQVEFDKFGERRSAIEKAIKQRHIDQSTSVSDHFTLPDYSISHIELFPLELINSNRDAIREARENFLIFKGKILEPYGMNRCYET